jgi:hypothetical protein
MSQLLTRLAATYEQELGEAWDGNKQQMFYFLDDRPQIYKENMGSHRWWDDWFYVVKIDDLLIGYLGARANRDESITEIGWEFDLSSICEVEPVEVTTVVYRPKA